MPNKHHGSPGPKPTPEESRKLDEWVRGDLRRIEEREAKKDKKDARTKDDKHE